MDKLEGKRLGTEKAKFSLKGKFFELKDRYKNYSMENNDSFKDIDSNLHDYLYMEDMALMYTNRWYQKGIFVSITNRAKDDNRGYLSDFESVMYWIPISKEKFEANIGRNVAVKGYKLNNDIYPYLEEMKVYMRDIMSTSYKDKYRSYFDKKYAELESYTLIKELIDKHTVKIPYLMSKKITRELERYKRYINGERLVYKESDYGLPQGYLANGFPKNKFACIPYIDLQKILTKAGIDLVEFEHENRVKIEYDSENALKKSRSNSKSNRVKSNKSNTQKANNSKNVSTNSKSVKNQIPNKKQVNPRTNINIPKPLIASSIPKETRATGYDTEIVDTGVNKPSIKANKNRINKKPVIGGNKNIRKPMNTDTARYSSPLLTDEVIRRNAKKK